VELPKCLYKEGTIMYFQTEIFENEEYFVPRRIVDSNNNNLLLI
jgi:hypothetical protein